MMINCYTFELRMPASVLTDIVGYHQQTSTYKENVAESLSSTLFWMLFQVPTYMMSIFPILDGVIQRLDKIRRDYLWKGIKENDSTVQHLVKLNKVLWGKKQGGFRSKKSENAKQGT
ncbi:hypothetical protein H5410_005927 [Solanum commersonii]|uniref:Uncharacterized protein n=1 Tax=Solanum commersonii TaxID=4109 RepID=A0A9J6A7Y5_SOLCO|nr:hypothetical protein H5410_005927 [Solanum commersonii]